MSNTEENDKYHAKKALEFLGFAYDHVTQISEDRVASAGIDLENVIRRLTQIKEGSH